MKKSFLKLVTALTIALLLGGLPLASAAEGTPPVEDDGAPTAEGMPKFQINGDPCLDAQETQIAVILEEGFENSTPKDNPNNAFEQVKTCYRVNMCKLTKVYNSLGVLDQDETKKYIERMVCQSEIKETCPEEYQKIYNPQAAATSKEPYVTCQKVQVLLSKKGGAGLIYLYVGTIYRWAASLVGILCVLIIIVNGIIISASAGDQQAVTNAKTRITQSIVALVILFLSALILNTANPNFFTSDGPTPEDLGNNTPPAAAPGDPQPKWKNTLQQLED